MAVWMQREKFKQRIDFRFEIALLHPTQSPDQLKVFPPGQIGIQMRFLRNIAQALAVSSEIFLNVVAVELDDAARRLQQSGQHLYRCAFAGAVRAQASQYLSRPQRER